MKKSSSEQINEKKCGLKSYVTDSNKLSFWITKVAEKLFKNSNNVLLFSDFVRLI